MHNRLKALLKSSDLIYSFLLSEATQQGTIVGTNHRSFSISRVHDGVGSHFE